MLKRISALSSGRRTKWFVLVAWLILAVVFGSLWPKLQESTVNEPQEFLPKSAESTRAFAMLKNRFPEGRDIPAILVFARRDGLRKADRIRIADLAARLSRPDALIDAEPALVPFTKKGDLVSNAKTKGQFSKDGTTATVLIPMSPPDSDPLIENVDRIREVIDAGSDGLEAHVTGPAGFLTDTVKIFESVDGTLLRVTITLVLLLLLIVYRSPVVALVPLLVVGISYAVASGIVYLLVNGGAFEVNGQTTALLIVLMFGAGTDYALLIVNRYREELRRYSDKHDAMAHATERTAPAILSAGGTVVAAMLVLTVADVKSTESMGPVLALGVAIMLLAGLTLLPALLAILGRKSFWPAVPRKGSAPRRPFGVWRRIGHLVHDRPYVAMLTTIAVLGAGAFGTLIDKTDISFGQGFLKATDSEDGEKLLNRALPKGEAATNYVLVDRDKTGTVSKTLVDDEAVIAVRKRSVSKDGQLERLLITLKGDPFSNVTEDQIPRLRSVAEKVAAGKTALVAGTTAANYDTNKAIADDANLIVPGIIVVVFLILVLLLRAVVAPLYLVATVILSFAFTLGVSILLFTQVFGMSGTDPGLATFAFIFLVALGVDYNIFLISRVREESEKLGTKDGVIKALETTGGVITSAGLILAGTFSAMMILPLQSLFQLGFTVALGVLVDTFIVRTILVPSIAFKLGKWNWWPSKQVT